MASVSHQGMTSPALRGTDRAEDIGLRCAVAGRPRARATSGPSACELIRCGLHLPQLYLDAFREPRPDLRQFGGEVAQFTNCMHGV